MKRYVLQTQLSISINNALSEYRYLIDKVKLDQNLPDYKFYSFLNVNHYVQRDSFALSNLEQKSNRLELQW